MPNLGGPEAILVLVLFLLPVALVLFGIYGIARLAVRKELQRAGEGRRSEHSGPDRGERSR